VKVVGERGSESTMPRRAKAGALSPGCGGSKMRDGIRGANTLCALKRRFGCIDRCNNLRFTRLKLG
jgi:hypothetical protein